MTPEEFMSLSMKDKLETVNKMLENEQKDHLKNVSKKIGIPYNTFTKIMRDNGSFQYNQTSKQYEKLLSLEEYDRYLQSGASNEDGSNESLRFLKEHLEELKNLLSTHANQLVLNPKVYDPSCKTANKSLQVNVDIYDRFAELTALRFPHLRQRDLISQCLLEFCQRYEKAPTD